jgi:mono/diheme cytochrome c family protein
MIASRFVIAATAAWLAFLLIHVVPAGAAAGRQTAGGWTLPPNAAEEKSPLTVNDAVLTAGRKVFQSKCIRCHGPEARGDGPDADRTHREHMDLTSAARASANPDGVLFHKVWNGRSSPRMPRFGDELSREQVWAVVAYVQSLRKRS